jgi:putative flippase GtrA
VNNVQQTTKQAGKFTVVGFINTFIDFAVLNLLVFLGFTAVFMVFNQKFLIANVVSVAMAMINSFILNKQWVFRSEGGSVYLEIVKFLIITIFGMFVVHQLIFNFFYYQFHTITDFIAAIINFIGFGAFFSYQFILLNFSKVIAVIGSLTWNFIGYKFFVFKEKKEEIIQN